MCADCKILRKAARDAVTRYAKAQRRLAIARLQQDSPQIGILEPVAQRLDQARCAAVRAYQEHVDTHTPKAARRGV
jgi:hypothetical protein